MCEPQLSPQARAALSFPLVLYIAWGTTLASENTANKRVSPSLVAFYWIHPDQFHLSNDPNQTSQVSFPASCPVGGSSSHLAGHPHLQWVWGESCGGQVLGLGDEP